MGKDEEWDQASLRRRLAALRLPVAPLRRVGLVLPADRASTLPEPEAVGVGPDGTALAVWRFRAGGERRQVTWHVAGRRRVAGSVDVATGLRVSFVQPLPEGRVLLAAARVRADEPNAEVWSAEGELLHRGHVGDAVEDLVTTPSGRVWVSYFDEAMGGRGPEGHGLARFAADLSVDWLYPLDAGLPSIADCYTLNVARETAYFCPYTSFHILSAKPGADGTTVTDWGPSPARSAHHLLRQGQDLALLRGAGPEYDVATMVRIGEGDPRLGGRCRVVLPDGLEIARVRFVGRGGDLHGFLRSAWFHLDLETLRRVCG